ncbi:hypothetical protein Gasu2_15560 [Galdieria sulphuraria]|nr:hypothetical protein Gasu2_15560 [Galdieria sulphuraria]
MGLVNIRRDDFLGGVIFILLAALATNNALQFYVALVGLLLSFGIFFGGGVITVMASELQQYGAEAPLISRQEMDSATLTFQKAWFVVKQCNKKEFWNGLLILTSSAATFFCSLLSLLKILKICQTNSSVLFWGYLVLGLVLLVAAFL